ncbi:MAG: hypothetical protein HUU55_22075 [Myxococcales bacterium]|nr:hypothetical protein [Myxococcales bacterium]
MTHGNAGKYWSMVVLLVAAPSFAAAQAPSPNSAVVIIPELPEIKEITDADRAAAEQAAEDTKAKFAAADYQAAASAAQWAYHQLPNANMALRWAMILGAQNKHRDSFATYLLAYSLDPTDDERTRIEAGLAEQARLCDPPMGWVHIRSTPAAKVMIGHQQTWSQRWVGLSEGKHELVFEAKGYESQSTALQVTPGSAGSVDVVLKQPDADPPRNDVVPPNDSPIEATTAETAIPPIPEFVPWTVLGTGVAIAAVGVGMHVWSREAAETRDSLSRPVEGMDDVDRVTHFLEAHNDAQDRATAAYVLYGVGGAAIATGVVLFFFPESETESAALVPVLSLDRVGVLGTF